MPPSLILRGSAAAPPSPRVASPYRRCLASPSFRPTRAPSTIPLRLHPASLRATARVVDVGDGGTDGLIPVSRLYEGRLARLELAGAARREQAVAAAAAADGGAVAAGAEAMVVEAFLPGPDGGGVSVSSTRVVSELSSPHPPSVGLLFALPLRCTVLTLLLRGYCLVQASVSP